MRESKWENLGDHQIMRQQLDKMDQELKQLRNQNSLLSEKNYELAMRAQIINPNKEDLQRVQTQRQLISKTRFLSRSVLQLSKIIIKLRQQRPSDDILKRLNEQLSAKDQLASKLNDKIELLEKQIVQQRLQFRYSLMPQQSYNQLEQNVQVSSQQKIAKLQAKIKEHQEEKKTYDYLFINERNIIQQFRKQLEQKQFQLQEKEHELNSRNIRSQTDLRQRRTALQQQYIAKIKSLKQFNAFIMQEDPNSKLRSMEMVNLLNAGFNGKNDNQYRAIDEVIRLYLNGCLLKIEQRDREVKRLTLQNKKKQLNDRINKQFTTVISQL